MKEKYGALIKDLFLFMISTFIPKAISFFLVPLYTNCLTTAEYGKADLLSTTVGLTIPLLTLDINDAVMRFTIENKNDERPFQIGMITVLKGIVLVITVVIINGILGIIEINDKIGLFFVLNYTFISIYGICLAYLRAIGRVKILSAISIVVTVGTIFSNILFLLVLRIGLTGYMISGCIGYAIADILILYKIDALKLLKHRNGLKDNLKRQMIEYSAPLIAANISWWINSSADRYFITAMCGVDANGIYSVAYKIPTILQMLQSVFSQAWLLSVFREYKSDNGTVYVGNVYEIYYVAMSISCAVLIALDIPLARFLYAKDFFIAWKYVPLLLLSVVFIANAGFFESLLTLQKKSKLVAGTTVIGAVVNIVLNFILINLIGIMGAAIATICGYFVMWVTRIWPVMKEYPFFINWSKSIVLYILLCVEIVLMVLFQNYMACIFIIIVMCLLNVRIVKEVIEYGYEKLIIGKRGK